MKGIINSPASQDAQNGALSVWNAQSETRRSARGSVIPFRDDMAWEYQAANETTALAAGAYAQLSRPDAPTRRRLNIVV